MPLKEPQVRHLGLMLSIMRLEKEVAKHSDKKDKEQDVDKKKDLQDKIDALNTRKQNFKQILNQRNGGRQ